MANHSYSHNLSNRSVLVRNYLLHEFDIGRCVACVSLIVSSLLSNSVIVFSYCLNYKMRTTTNTMVLNHCLVDIFLALSDIAFYLTPAYVPRLMDIDLFCNLSVSFDSLLKAASILSMCGIAIDRYINLVRASRKRMTKGQAIATLAWCWVQSTIVAIPWNKHTRSEDTISERTLCHSLPRLFEAGLPLNSLSVFFKTPCVLLPLLGICYVSYRIFSALRRRRKVKMGDSLLRATRWISAESFVVRTQSRSPITAFILFIIYITCTAPFIVAIVWTMFPENRVLAPGVAFAVYFSFRLKGSLFPVLYILRNRFVLNSLHKLCCNQYSTKARILSGGNASVQRNSEINLADWNWITPRQAVTNGFQWRGARQDSRIFYVTRTATVKLDFTDLKTERGDSL